MWTSSTWGQAALQRGRMRPPWQRLDASAPAPPQGTPCGLWAARRSLNERPGMTSECAGIASGACASQAVPKPPPKSPIPCLWSPRHRRVLKAQREVRLRLGRRLAHGGGLPRPVSVRHWRSARPTLDGTRPARLALRRGLDRADEAEGLWLVGPSTHARTLLDDRRAAVCAGYRGRTVYGIGYTVRL